MELNGIPGGRLSGMSSGVLGLEIPLNQHHQPNHQHQLQHQQMVTFAASDPHHHTQPQQSDKQLGYNYTTEGKQQQLTLSDEDEPGFTAEDCFGDGRKRMSPWQRVKWTDNMVRLLIMVVFYVEEEGGPEGSDPSSTGKKKSGGMLQKKGKWKSVSQTMMEKGFCVSPQQCEDKFNDLNKRYKRVNDIIGKGTACRVVENQSLLDQMDHILPRMKEEVRKLLNSKHLFFREMCAYHNSGSGGAAGARQSSEASQHQQQQQCFHSSDGAALVANSRSRVDVEGFKIVNGGRHEEGGNEVGEDEDDDDEDDDEDEEEEEEETEDAYEKGRDENGGGHEENASSDKLSLKRKRRRDMSSSLSMLSSSMQQLRYEMMNVLQDTTKSVWEQRQWIRSRSMQLEEHQVKYQFQAFELEKQRLKWLKFSGKKEREMERMKLDNERMKLENERMVLFVRQKELELLDHHRQHSSSEKRPD